MTCDMPQICNLSLLAAHRNVLRFQPSGRVTCPVHCAHRACHLSLLILSVSAGKNVRRLFPSTISETNCK
jgi:hypothetical protein